MANNPQQWGPGPDGAPRPDGPPPQGSSAQGGPYAPQGQQAYAPQGQQPYPPQGQQAYAPQPPHAPGPQPYGPAGRVDGAPRKKSKLPLVLGIVAGLVVLAILAVVLLMATVFKAPTVAVGRTGAIFDAPGVAIGSSSLVNAKKSSGTFNSSDECSKRLTAAAAGSDSVVEASNSSSAMGMVGRTRDAAATNKVFDGLDAVFKGCSTSSLTMRQKGANIGNANGVTYKEFVLEQPKSTSSPRTDLVLVKYGNTWGVFLARPGTLTDAKDLATSYGARVKAAAK